MFLRAMPYADRYGSPSLKNLRSASQSGISTDGNGHQPVTTQGTEGHPRCRMAQSRLVPTMSHKSWHFGRGWLRMMSGFLRPAVRIFSARERRHAALSGLGVWLKLIEATGNSGQ